MLDRYRLGRSGDAERSGIINWLTGLDLFRGTLSKEDIRSEQQRSLNELRTNLFNSPPAKVIRFPVWIRTVAASLIVLSALGIWQYKTRQSKIPALQWAETYTVTGEVKEVTLTDGSRIVLNSESRLRYPTAFTGQERQVFLQGQGFFKVTHNARKPFRVHANKIDVQVLGTSFDVKAYGNDPFIEVAVATGKVAVTEAGGKSKAHFLTPGKGFIYQLSTGQPHLHSVEIASLGTWQQRRISFKNQSLESITRELQRYFKVKFVFANQQIKQTKLSLSIRNQNLDMVMKALSASGGFHYQMDKNTVTINK